MLDPDQVVAALTALIVQDALNGGHVLAGDVLIHDDELRVPILALTPQLVDDVLVTAVGVTAHDHSLIQTRKVAEGFFLVAMGIHFAVDALAALLKDAVPIPALEAILAAIVIVTAIFTVRLYRGETEKAVSD